MVVLRRHWIRSAHSAVVAKSHVGERTVEALALLRMLEVVLVGEVVAERRMAAAGASTDAAAPGAGRPGVLGE